MASVAFVPANNNNTNTGSSLTCISCRLLFSTSKEQREHYKEDLHRFNLKRKVLNLPPVTPEAFQQKVEVLLSNQQKGNSKSSLPAKDTQSESSSLHCSVCNKQYSSVNSYTQHIKSKKHQEKLSQLKTTQPNLSQHAQQESDEAQYKRKQQDEEDETLKESISFPRTEDSESPVGKEGDKDEDLSEEEQMLIDAKIRQAKALTLEDCLFCSEKSQDFQSNMNHMTLVHGLFIPDIEYVQDLTGFITYLGEKVSVGNICLSCNGKGRQLHSLEAVQAHMRDLGHCKLAYDDEDLDEYSDFYDFSRDYTKDSMNDTDENSTQKSSPAPVRLSEDGSELVFENGKAVGHRSFQIYYKQQARMHNDSQAVALVKNYLFNQYKLLGWKAGSPQNNNQNGALTVAPRTSVEERKRKWEHYRVQKQQMRLGVKNNNYANHRLQNEIIA